MTLTASPFESSENRIPHVRSSLIHRVGNADRVIYDGKSSIDRRKAISWCLRVHALHNIRCRHFGSMYKRRITFIKYVERTRTGEHFFLDFFRKKRSVFCGETFIN